MARDAPRDQKGEHIRRVEVSFVTVADDIKPFGGIAQRLARGFRELDTPFDVVYLNGPRQESGDGLIRELHLGVRRSRHSVWRLLRYFQASKPKIVFTQPGHLAPFVVIAGRLSNTPVVPWDPTILELDVLDASPSRFVHIGLPFLQRLVYRHAHGIACVSDDVAVSVKRRVGGRISRERVRVIHNPVDIHEVRRHSGRTASQPDGSNFRICTASRLVRAKGIDVLIEALALARSTLKPAWELVIAGDGARRAELEQLVRKHELEDNVRFLGFLESPYRMMASCHVFVHPSRWDGFPISVLEALSLGLPVVATDCPGGHREMLGDSDFGILVRTEDPAHLAEAIIRLERDIELWGRLSQRAIRRAEEFTPTIIASQILAMRDELATPKDSGGAQSGARPIGRLERV